VVIIESERLILREFEESDWQAVHDYASDPKVVRYMDWGPNTEEETRSFINRSISYQEQEPRRNYTLAITLRLDSTLMGGCGIYITDPENRKGWLGFCLNRRFWGQGYATETAEALLTFGFEKLGLHRIFATCDPHNIASAHILEKINMQLEGRLRENKWAKGKWRDSLIYAILESEWKKRNESILIQ
jgi:ribosomal-protein-alanine N-acetyltransferase